MADDPDPMKWTAPTVRAAALDKPRNAIWNADQLATVLAATGVGAGARVVDVGAGSGGMLELFAELLPDSTFTCIDREPPLTEATVARARELDVSDRVTALTADAAALPLPAGAFDLGFCQTVLMHVADASRVVAELVRVVRPGGAIVIVEGNAIIRPNLMTNVAPDSAAAILRLWQLIRIGRRQLGRGDLAVGEEVPAMLAAAGVELIEVRLVDRLRAAGPATPEAWRREHLALLERAGPVFALWRPGFLEAFIAAGGRADEFDHLWQVWREAEEGELAAVRAGASRVLAGLLYAFVGVKTASRA